jgi:hypothetical protein
LTSRIRKNLQNLGALLIKGPPHPQTLTIVTEIEIIMLDKHPLSCDQPFALFVIHLMARPISGELKKELFPKL